MFNGFTNWLGSVAHSIFGGGNNNQPQQQQRPSVTPGFTSAGGVQTFSNNDWAQQQADEERKRREAELAAQQQAAKEKADADAAAAKSEQDQKLAQQKQQDQQGWQDAVTKAGEGQNFLQNFWENLNGDNTKVANSVFQAHLANQASQQGDTAQVQSIANQVNDPRNRVNGHALDGAVNFMDNTVAPIATNIPVMGGVINAGAGLDNMLNPNNPDVQNAYDRLNVGMSPEDLQKLKQSNPDQAARAEQMGALMGWAGAPMSALDAMSLGGAGTATKLLLKEGMTSDIGKSIIKDTLSHIPLGMGVGAGLDTAGQNYMNNGDVTNFNGFDPMHAASSAAQGALWSLIPESKAHAADLATGNHTTVGDLSEDAGVGDFASKPPAHEVLASQLENIKDQASRLPDDKTIDTTATQAGQISEGVSSPSKVQTVKQALTDNVNSAKATLQDQYTKTLQGINDLTDSMTPKPLAMATATPGEVPLQGRDLAVPQKPQVLEAKAAGPQQDPFAKPTPESAPVEPPSTAKSKAAAAQVPSSAPIKVSGPASMSDQEILDRFGASNPGKSPQEIRDQFAANTKQLADEKSVKAAQADAKAQAKAAKAAAFDQAAKDAGVTAEPQKDIFGPMPEKAAKQADNRAEFIDTKATEKAQQAANRAQFIADKKAANPDDKNIPKYEAADKKLTEKDAKTIAEYKATDKKLTAKTIATKDNGYEKMANQKLHLKEVSDGNGNTFHQIYKETPLGSDRVGKEYYKTKAAATRAFNKEAEDMPVKPKAVKEETLPTPEEGKKVDEQIAKPIKPQGKNKDPFAKSVDNTEVPAKPKDEGIITGTQKTGEKKTSQGVVKKKYEEISHVKGDAAAAEAAKSVNSKDFIKHLQSKTDINYGEMLTAKHLIDRVPAGSKEAADLKNAISEHKTKIAQTLGADVGNNRKTASSKQISALYQKKLDNSGISLSKGAWNRVAKANDKFTKARDDAQKLENEARDNPTPENVAKLEQAVNSVDLLDRQAHIAQYKEAYEAAVKDLKKGEKLGPDQRATLAKMKKDAHVFQYDAVDSSLLSATGTMINNAVNGLTGLGELVHSTYGSAIAKGITGKATGGASGHGLVQGFKDGVKSIRDEVKLRNEMNGVGVGKPGKVWGAYKNTVTTANELSEIPTRMRIQSQLESHYRQLNQEAGFKGDELKQRTRIDALTDPNGFKEKYSEAAYATQGMNNISHAVNNDRKLETGLQNEVRKGIEDFFAGKLGEGKGRDAASFMAKWTTRALVGFPSVVFKSGLKEGLKRTPVIGTVHDLIRISKAADPAEKSRLINELVQHTGSGLTYSALGAALTSAGMMTGAYPTDPNEQKRWQKEGKTEWSVKIGNDWFDMRKSLGAFALPLMITSQLTQDAKNGTDPLTSITDAAEALLGVTPVDGIFSTVSNWKQLFSGQDTKNKSADMAAQFARVGIPASGALNELAKMSTALMGGNELETKDSNWAKQFFGDLAATIPGGGEAAGLTPKMVDDTNITSTSVLGRLFGAQKGYNQAGADDNAKKQTAANNVESQFNQSIADQDTSDKIKAVLDPANQGLFDQVRSGKELPPEKLKTLEDAVKKIADGSQGYDSKFAQEGDWKSQSAVLKTTQSLMQQDPQTKPSQQQEIDAEVKRVDIAQKNNVDPKIYELYRTISNGEWNSMIDPTKPDTYDPQTAGDLKALDDAMTAAGVSRNGTGQDPTTRNKYLESKKNAGGSGGSKKNEIATNVSIIGSQAGSSGSSNTPTYRKTVGALPQMVTPQSVTPPDYKKTISVTSGVQL